MLARDARTYSHHKPVRKGKEENVPCQIQLGIEWSSQFASCPLGQSGTGTCSANHHVYSPLQSTRESKCPREKGWHQSHPWSHARCWAWIDTWEELLLWSCLLPNRQGSHLVNLQLSPAALSLHPWNLQKMDLEDSPEAASTCQRASDKVTGCFQPSLPMNWTVPFFQGLESARPGNASPLVHHSSQLLCKKFGRWWRWRHCLRRSSSKLMGKKKDPRAAGSISWKQDCTRSRRQEQLRCVWCTKNLNLSSSVGNCRYRDAQKAVTDPFLELFSTDLHVTRTTLDIN